MAQCSGWPIIVNSSLSDHQVTRLLQHQQHKLRFTESTIEGTYIFPLSKVAFYLLPLCDAMVDPRRAQYDKGNPLVADETIERIDKFQQLHRQCYVICSAAVHGDPEHQLLYQLQKRFLGSHVAFLVSHNHQETTECMLTIAQGCLKKRRDLSSATLDSFLQSQDARGTAWEVLQYAGLGQADQDCLEKGLGSLSRVMTSSAQELEFCGLPPGAATRLASFCDATNQSN